MSPPEALRRAALADPDGTGLEVDGGEQLTYGAWERRSDAVAAALSPTVGRGDRVALLFDSAHWTEYAVAHLAVNKIGAAAVPLSVGSGEIELGRILRHCDPAVVLAPPELAPRTGAVPHLDLSELEARGRDLPARRPSISPLIETLYRPRPLGPATPQPFLGASELEDEPLVHAFPPGTQAALVALRACLGGRGTSSVAVPEFDSERICALIEAAPERACGLHPATALAVLESGATVRHDVSHLTRLVLASGYLSAVLLMRLSEAFPLAKVLLIDGPGARAVQLHSPGRSRAPRTSSGSSASARRSAGTDPDPELAPIRETVGAVWSRVLRRDEVPPERDFFALGGDADAVAGVMRLLEDAFEVPIPPAALIEWPTVAQLSKEVARLRAETRSHADGDHGAPAAFSQEGMVWHELFAPGCQNLPGLARRYRGPLDVVALSRALDDIVRRHGALRTGFEVRAGRLVQTVRPHRPLDLEVRDFRALSADERDLTVARTVAEAGQRPFDLALDPLFVPTLLRLGEQDHVLVIRTHHSVFDDWSVGVFRRQLARLYNAYAAGEASPLPEPALQFTDFARRQRADLAGPAGARELTFWRRELAGAPFTAQLLVDDPSAPPGTPQPGGETVPLTLAPELHGRLRALARQERATLFMTMLAAFGVLVHRYTGQEDLVMATVVANRNRTELEGLIGCFTKKVPFRLRLDGDPTFSALLARARDHLLGALTHQDLPFEVIVQDVLGSAAADHGLVPHVALMFQGVTPGQELVLDGVQSAGLETAAQAGRAHFMAGGERSGAELPPPAWGGGLYAGTFVILSIDESGEELSCTARGAFHAPAVRGLLARYRTLLASLVADPGRPISELGLLDEPARAEALDLGRGARVASPLDTLSEALRAQVSRAPDTVAVRARTAEVTFAELNARSEALAARLRAAGAARGCRVGTVLDASLELIVAVLGIWKAGGAWVGLDPTDGAERRARIVSEAGVEIVIGEEGIARLDAATAGGRADDAAVLFYGSGNSTTEHGVVLDHGAVLNLLSGLHDAGASHHRTSLCPPATDDAFLRRLVALLGGDTLYIPDRPLPAAPGAIIGLLAQGAIDLIDGTPEELEALVAAGLASALPEGIDAVVVIGTRGPVSPELLRAVRGARGICPHVLYGPPECGFGATAAARAARGVGRPLAGVSVSVLDPHGAAVPIGAIGELHVGGASLARPYSAEAEPAPGRGRFATRAGERRYASGHLARLLADGSVELLGPVGRDFELRGFRVETARIEAALTGCPGLDDVQVVLERDGEGEPRLVAYLVADGTAPTLARLRTFLWERLPGYALPSRLVVRGAAPEHEADATELPEESILNALWAAELGVDRLAPRANYWQVFSFLDALAAAREAGVTVLDADVSRNRTLGTLATAVSAAGASRDP